MEKMIKVALKSGYIKAPESAFVNNAELQKLDDNQITIITTGSQGEALAALSRIANGIHKQILQQFLETKKA